MEILDLAKRGGRLNLLWSNMLRLKDSGRLRIYKESVALAAFVESVIKDGRIYSVCQPHRAQELEETALASIWIHDRMRDAVMPKCMLVCSIIFFHSWTHLFYMLQIVVWIIFLLWSF